MLRGLGGSNAPRLPGEFGKVPKIRQLAGFLPYTQQIAACDAQIQQQYSAMKPRWEGTAPLPTPKPHRKRSKNEPTFDVRADIIRLTGVDITAVDGIGDSLAQTMLAEIGTDMSKWPNEKQFTSWLGVAPRNDVSGGKVLRSRTLPSNNRAGQAFRQAATAVSNSSSAFGAFYRRKRAQGGPLHAQVATANKIARTVYHMLKYHVQYEDMGVEEFERRHRERDIKALRNRAAKLGLTLVDSQSVQSVA